MHTEERGIDLLPSGKYRVRVQQGGKPIKVPLCSTLDEAVRIRDALYSKLGEGELLRIDGITVAQWGPTWLRKYRSDNRTSDDDRQRFEMHVATAPFAMKAMATVEQRDLSEWLVAQREKMTQYRYGDRNGHTLSYSTRKRCLALIRCLLTDAVAEGLIKSNPAIGLRVKKTAADKLYDQLPKEWPLNAQEQALLDQALSEDRERHIVNFALGTAIRQGEQWNLHLVDVHVDVPDPWIWIQFGSKDGPPKNGKPRRVRLFGRALDAMREWLAILPDYAPYNPYGLVFPTPAYKHVPGDGRRSARGGGRRTEGKVPACWDKVKAAVNRHVWWHLLRHTCATSLLCGLWGDKWRIEDVAMLLGHGSTKTTEIYAHFLDDALNEPVARMQVIWDAREREGDVVTASSQEPTSFDRTPKSFGLRNRKSEVRIFSGAQEARRVIVRWPVLVSEAEGGFGPECEGPASWTFAGGYGASEATEPQAQ